MRKFTVLLLLSTLLGACASPKLMLSERYQERPTLRSSLFSSDQEILSEEAIERILSSKIVLSENAKLAVMKFPSKSEQTRARYYYGYSYWQSEEYLKIQQQYFDTLFEPLTSSERIVEVTLLPSLLVPEDATISLLREAAVRLQADLLLVFSTNSNVYEKYAIWGKDKVKAFCTCEVVLLDVRTGVLPFTFIATEEYEGRKEKKDINNQEMRLRAENEAVMKALTTAANELVAFFESIPKSQDE